jgi:hypothetical protein
MAPRRAQRFGVFIGWRRLGTLVARDDDGVEAFDRHQSPARRRPKTTPSTKSAALWDSSARPTKCFGRSSVMSLAFKPKNEPAAAQSKKNRAEDFDDRIPF